MTDYKHITTIETKLSPLTIIIEGLLFVLTFAGLMVVITLLSY